MYRMQDRVHFSQMGVNGAMTLPAVMDCMQDCSDFQSEDLGIGFDFLAGRNRGWVVAFWQLFIERRPANREKIVVETRPWKFEYFYGFRNFAIYDAAGEAIVKANSLWCFLDTEKNRPVRPEPEEIGPYGLDERLEMEYAKIRKIRIPDGGEKREPFPAEWHHLDRNGHVNNVQYVKMALSLFRDEPDIAELRVEYRKAAKSGELICPVLAKDGEWTVISLNDENEKPYCVVSFREHMLRNDGRSMQEKNS